jgi:ATP-dependent Clp protease ATP-binding subunit ClpC
MYKSPQAAGLQSTLAQLKAVREQKTQAIEEARYEDAADLRRREEELQASLDQLRMGASQGEGPRVTAEDIAEVVAMWTGIPVMRIAGEESERLLKMEAGLHERIVGQDEAIVAISKAVRRARAGLKDPRRPIGSFVFLGPTGVGKTELTKALAEFLFGSEEALIQLDMSEFMERHSISRLVGAPPGYVGYEEAGQLTEAIRHRPYSIVVFDEIEKAHPEAFNMLLQIMEEGHLADARGRKVDFRNAIIVLTSNIGADMIKRNAQLGFALPRGQVETEQIGYDEMRSRLIDALKKVFRPEFLNRLDGVVVFRSLTREEIRQIVLLEVAKVAKRLGEHALTLRVTDAGQEWLGRKGWDPDYGARPLKRVIQAEIEDVLSDRVLTGEFQPGSIVVVDAQDDKIVLRPANPGEFDDLSAESTGAQVVAP